MWTQWRAPALSRPHGRRDRLLLYAGRVLPVPDALHAALREHLDLLHHGPDQWDSTRCLPPQRASVASSERRGRDAVEGKGPQRRPQKPLDRRLEEVAKAVGGGYCRLQMPLKLALAVRETVAGHRLGAPGGGGGGGYLPLPMPPVPPWPGGRRAKGRDERRRWQRAAADDSADAEGQGAHGEGGGGRFARHVCGRG